MRGGHDDGGDGGGRARVAASSCGRIGGSRDGGLAACPVGVDVVTGTSGTARAVGSLVSLLAAMVGAEGRCT